MLTLQTKASSSVYTISKAEVYEHCNEAALMAGNLVMETGLEMLIPWNEIDCTEFGVQCMVDPNKCLFIARGPMNSPIGFIAGGVAHSFYNKMVKQAVEFGWWVHPAYRNGGVGHDLHKTYEEWAKSRGASVISMMHMGAPEVGRMYEKMGYSLRELSYTRKVD